MPDATTMAIWIPLLVGCWFACRRTARWIDHCRADAKLKELAAIEEERQEKRAARLAEINRQVREASKRGSEGTTPCGCGHVHRPLVSVVVGESREAIGVTLKCVRCTSAAFRIVDYDDEGFDCELIAKGKATLAGIARWNEKQAARVGGGV